VSRALIALAFVLVGGTARAQLIDRVVAFVDDEVILLSEVRERAEPARRSEPDAEPLAIYRRVLGEMIEAALIAREARRLSVVATDEEIREAMTNIGARNGMDDRQLRRALSDQGWTLPLYEQVLREQLLRMKVVQLHSASLPPITAEAVRAEWERRVATFEGERRYRAAELSEPAGADPAAARARLEERVDQLRSGSASASEVGAIEAGWVLASELTPRARAILEALEPGEPSPVQEMESSFVVLQLLEAGETQPAPFESQEATIRQELYAAQVRESEARLFEELRAETSIARRL
jgi:peptidyl-prolyl cis-trans isomerase SurA